MENAGKQNQTKEIKFTKEQLEKLTGTLLKVTYDGKEFVGLVDKVYLDYSNLENCGLIMKGTNEEWKHIKLRRLQKIESL